ncbi:TIM-barrel domain-containing protein [Catenovulum agarivorans]|uniref:TIM-barrel domain-containing protein n=1 Tax=Catenovulum agarivorans TaxID=1172192 RepID=UPI0002E8CF06|nr:TIM-barrel domain-containing protein [Catenovulum agarivorans]
MKLNRITQAVVAAGLPLMMLAGCGSDSSTASSQQSQQTKQLGSYQQTDTGLVVTLADSAAKKVQLTVINDKIIRVTATPHKDLSYVPESLMVKAQPAGKFSVKQQGDTVELATAKVTAIVSLADGQVSFKNDKGEVVLNGSNGGEFAPVTKNPWKADEKSYAVRQQWNKGSEEGLFGLGQHQNGQVNYSGENVELSTGNLVITIPFVVSTRNYGVLWDNASITNFGDPESATPLHQDLDLYDANGNKGGLTAKYYDGDKLLFTRVESDPDYQYLANNNIREYPFPRELGDVKQPRVEWQGYIKAKKSGMHKFRMYNSGYAKLTIDGQELLDRWRMNWNPWYHDTQIELEEEKKTPINISWNSQGGYFRLLHNEPRAFDEQYSLSFASESGKAIDYYFVAGENTDEVISGYRHLTGKSVMLPKWVYGFWQSRERYKNQQELVDVVKEYREREIPIDNIVLDWSYWPQDAWGSHDFDKEHFPNPKKMIDEVHDLNTNIMISVWPKFYSTTDNYKEFDEKGYMLNKNVDIEGNRDWIGPGYLNGFYDPYPEESQEIFWRQLNKKLNVLGIDAWWLDASEPDIHSNLSPRKRKEIMSPQSIGSGTEYFNSYALAHAEGVYKGERVTDAHKRSFILTRSGFGGIQRTGSAIWSGDTVPRWSNLKEQISAGISVGLAGMPNWTFDIGGFTPEDHLRWTSKGAVGHFSGLDEKDIPNWQELNVRWFQFGAFSPMFRSHGQNPYREIFNIADEGSEAYESMVYYTKLRYRLMPYIYSEAGHMYHLDDTLMRGLVMDFPHDKTAINLTEQYMFGPSFLVAPVTDFKARDWDVYLPSQTNWYDFYTGKAYQGGQSVKVDAPLGIMPLFVKAGSIVPTGPEIQHVFDKTNGEITLNVYTGADGTYAYYEDDGKSYNYEKGEYLFIDMSYDDAKGELTIGEQKGQYQGMPSTRKINVRWISGESDNAANFDKSVVTSIEYTGKAVTVKRS